MVYDGTIYVSFNPMRKAEALITICDIVAYAGTKSTATRLGDILGAEKIDLVGRTVIPGFIDAHAHLDGIGQGLETLDLRGTRSIDELKERLGSHSEREKNARWILGRNWDQELFEEKRWPASKDLDEVVHERAVALVRVCGHAAVLNSKALVECGIQTRDPESLGIARDEQGVPTGVLTGDALRYLNQKLISLTSDADRARQLGNGLRLAASLGVTTLDFVSCDADSFRVLQELRRKDALLVRIRIHITPDMLQTMVTTGLGVGFGDRWLKVSGVKTFADGSLGARTAWLSFPYEDDPDNQGNASSSEDELLALASLAEKQDLQLAVHGIGDRAVDLILGIFSRLEKIKSLRHRIEHCSIVRGDQIRRIEALGVPLVVQPHFAITDWWALNRVGSRRADYVYPFGTMIKEGIRVAFSTDSPVEPLDPWKTVYAAVTRGVYEEGSLSLQTSGEGISLEQALDCYTRGSAFALNEEANLGTLEPGHFADFLILEPDPFDVDAKELGNIRIDEAYVGGRRVHPM